MSNILVVSNREVYHAVHFKDPSELESWLLDSETPQPDTLLFVFWSWKVPTWMLNKYKCYGMHTGFLLEGKGKGGSPIDNLQKLGVKWAALNVFEMNEKFDEGRAVLAIPINLEWEKLIIIQNIAELIYPILQYLLQDKTNVPEVFKRIK